MASTRRLSIPIIVLYLVFLTAIVFAFARGLDYYLTPFSARPHHTDYRLLRPAGDWGLRYGILGASMLVAMLTYSLRKRTRLIGKSGRLKTWLDVHIFFGIIGSLLVVLHTSFKLTGLVAVSFWSMVAVALSGVFGRYLYIQIPRNLSGEAYDLDELSAQLQEKLEPLKHRLDEKTLNDLLKLITGTQAPGNQLAFLFWLAAHALTRSSRLRKTKRHLEQLGFPQAECLAVLESARDYAILNRRVATLRTVQSLFHHWHVFHRPFATVMYVVMLVHIAVALAFGIAWRSN